METASVLDGQQHLDILTGLAQYCEGVQRHWALGHWGIGVAPTDLTEVNEAPVVRRPINSQGEEHEIRQTTAFGKRGASAFEQETSSLSKRDLPWSTEEVSVRRRVIPGIVPAYKV